MASPGPSSTNSLHAQDISIAFPALSSWVRAAVRCDFNIEPLFNRYHISTDLTQLQEHRLAISTFDQLMESCMAASHGMHFPFALGECFTFDFMPELETYLSTSATLRDAAQALGWVRDMLNPYLDFRLQESGHIGRLVLAEAPPELPPAKAYNSESGFAAILRFMRLLLPAPAMQTASRVLRFRHSPPAYAAGYEPFFGLPVAFNQPVDAFEFDRDLLDLKLQGNFPSLHRQAAGLVQQRLNRMAQRQGMAAQVQNQLRLGKQTIEAVSQALNLHPRTMQRRLRNQGLSFVQLHDEAGFRTAVNLMHEGHTLDAIGEALGFSDRRSFTRAFKRWSGMPPSQFRKRLEP